MTSGPIQMEFAAGSFPRVTLAMPVYNGADTILRALESLDAQTWPNLEIIICDDCSRDNVYDICQKYVVGKDKFRLFKNEKNLGGYENFRHTLELGSGKYCSWVCADDYWAPDFVETLVSLLESESQAVLAGCDCVYFADEPTGSIETRFSIPDNNRPQFNSRFTNIRNVLFREGRAVGKNKDAFHLLMHGLMRRDILVAVLDSFDTQVWSERPVIAALCLSGKVFYSSKAMYFKNVTGRWKAEKFGDINIDSDNIRSTAFSSTKNLGGIALGLKVSRVFFRAPTISFVTALQASGLVLAITLRRLIGRYIG